MSKFLRIIRNAGLLAFAAGWMLIATMYSCDHPGNPDGRLMPSSPISNPQSE